LSARVESSEEEKGLGNQEDASKQGRIPETDADEDLSLINKTAQDHERMNNQDLFGVHDLDGDEVIVDITVGENVEQDATVAEKEVSTAADEVVTTTDDAEITIVATTPQISKDDVTLAQTSIEIKAAKPKATTTVTVVSTKPKEKEIIMQEPSEIPSPKLIVSSQQLLQPKDKGNAKIIEPERPLKRKKQIMMDEQIARDREAQIQADLEEEQMIAKEKRRSQHSHDC
nr:hypothetical protein [Tanacetum cinerariifolium]